MQARHPVSSRSSTRASSCALHEASSYIKTLENRQGLKVGCPEEIAWRSDWISDSQLIKISKPLLKSGYGSYLRKLIKTNKNKTSFL